MNGLNDDQYKLINLIGCPVAWEDTCTDEDFSALLRYMWFKVVQGHQLDRESSLLSNLDWRPDEFFIQSIYSDESIAWPMGQVSSWKPRAEKEYREKYKGFMNLRPAPPSIYSKHHAKASSTDAEVAKQSIDTGNSKLYPRFDHQKQTRLLWTSFCKVWLGAVEDLEIDVSVEENTSRIVDRFAEVFGQNVLRFSIETDDPAGCVNGVSSTFLTLEVDFSTPIAHVYPISEAEAKVGGADAIIYVSSEDLTT
jgi:hypothetical protein